MREAIKASEPSAQTTKPSRSARVTIRTSTPFQESARSGTRPLSEPGNESATSEPDESTWGWAKRIHFSAHEGWWVDED
jgi:hypothetical protein